ncbi:MAG: hypothetical protein WAL64_05490 [Candidatus Dormiibacterota bacterium]
MPSSDRFGLCPSSAAMVGWSWRTLQEYYEHLARVLSHHAPLRPSAMPTWWQVAADRLQDEVNRRGVQQTLF